MNFQSLTAISLAAVKKWVAHNNFLYSAAIAYYTVFSFPALFIFLAKVISLFIDQDVVRAEMTSHFQAVLGENVAHNLNEIIDRSLVHADNQWAYLLGFIVLVFGATRLIVELQTVFNDIWETKESRNAWWLQFIYQRLLSIAIVLLIGFVILISMISTIILGFIRGWIAQYAPDIFITLLQITKFSASFLIICILFTALLKILPNAHVPWRAALAGGGISTILFILGEYGLNLYFKLAEPHTIYGAAGTIILLMLWVYYICHVLLFGATLSYTLASRDK